MDGLGGEVARSQGWPCRAGRKVRLAWLLPGPFSGRVECNVNGRMYLDLD